MAAQYGRPLYFAAVVSIFVFFFSSPILSGRRLDVYYTSTQDVCDRCVTSQCRSEIWSTQLADNTGCEQSPSVQHCSILSCYIFATAIVWRAKGKIIIRSVLCSIVCNNCTQWTAHTYEQTNSSLDWVLSHWAHFTVLRFIFVYVYYFVSWLYIACMCSV